jgi:hypothetical protein
MNRLVLSSLMVMAFGTALGASVISSDRITASGTHEALHSASLPTPAQIAAWKATATSTDYTPPAPPR